MKLTQAGPLVTVPLEINGETAPFILDTGAARSVISEAAAARLGLARDEWVGTTMRGIGGIGRRPNADPRTLTLGGVPLVRRTLSHDTSLAVSPLLRGQDESPRIEGLLGRDFLASFDLDLDVPAHRLTLFTVQGCSGDFLSWKQAHSVLPVTEPADSALIVPVVLNGTILRAMLDTGASASLLAAPGMHRLGVSLADVAADPGDTVRGVGPRAVIMRRHVFRSMQVSGAVISDPAIWVSPVRLVPVADMLLGMDWASRQRLWISFATRQIFVARP